jgi:hypothetical protein
MSSEQLTVFNALSATEKHDFINKLKQNFITAGNNGNYATQDYIQAYLNTIPKF